MVTVGVEESEVVDVGVTPLVAVVEALEPSVALCDCVGDADGNTVALGLLDGVASGEAVAVGVPVALELGVPPSDCELVCDLVGTGVGDACTLAEGVTDGVTVLVAVPLALELKVDEKDTVAVPDTESVGVGVCVDVGVGVGEAAADAVGVTEELADEDVEGVRGDVFEVVGEPDGLVV